MSLQLVFYVAEGTGEVDLALAALEQVLKTQALPLSLVASEPNPTIHEQLKQMAERHNADLIRLNAGVHPQGVFDQLAADGATQVLVFGPADRLSLPGLSALVLAGAGAWRMPHAFWCGADPTPLPGPEAARQSGISDGFPDPTLLVRSGYAPFWADPWKEPARAWVAYEKALNQESVAQLTLPVVLRPFPIAAHATRAVQALGASTDIAAFTRRVLWVGDALALSGPEQVPQTLDAIEALWLALPPDLRTRAHDVPGPMGQVLRAYSSAGGRWAAQSELTLLALARQEQLAVAMMHSHARLSRDLDLALPGPEYLRELYLRIRGA